MRLCRSLGKSQDRNNMRVRGNSGCHAGVPKQNPGFDTSSTQNSIHDHVHLVPAKIRDTLKFYLYSAAKQQQ